MRPRYFLSPFTRIGLREVNIPTCFQRSYHPFNLQIKFTRKSPVHQSTIAISLCSNSGFCRGMAPNALCVQSIGRKCCEQLICDLYPTMALMILATGSFYVQTITWHLTRTCLPSTTPRSMSSSDHKGQMHTTCKSLSIRSGRCPSCQTRGLWLGDTDTGKGFSDCSPQDRLYLPALLE